MSRIATSSLSEGLIFADLERVGRVSRRKVDQNTVSFFPRTLPLTGSSRLIMSG